MFLGIIIFVLGGLYLLEQVIPSFSVNYQILGPIALILFAGYHMLKNRKFDIFMTILLGIGVWFLCLNLEFIPDRYLNIFWPCMIMLVGLSIVISTLTFKNKVRVVNHKDGIAYYGIFSGLDEKVKSSNFKNAVVYSIFGGVDLDLRDIKIKDDKAVITVYSIFGGSELTMPEEYNLEFSSTAIFGGNENGARNQYEEGRKTIYVNCISVFGGAELK